VCSSAQEWGRVASVSGPICALLGSGLPESAGGLGIGREKRAKGTSRADCDGSGGGGASKEFVVPRRVSLLLIGSCGCVVSGHARDGVGRGSCPVGLY